DGDEAFVLELVQRRVDRSRAGCPPSTGSVGDGLHQLVAMHRLLGEQQQDRRPHVAARNASTTAAAATHRAVRPTMTAVTVSTRPARSAEATGSPVAVTTAPATWIHRVMTVTGGFEPLGRPSRSTAPAPFRLLVVHEVLLQDLSIPVTIYR